MNRRFPEVSTTRIKPVGIRRGRAAVTEEQLAPARSHRDALGRVNIAFADAADEAFFIVAARALPLPRSRPG